FFRHTAFLQDRNQSFCGTGRAVGFLPAGSAVLLRYAFKLTTRGKLGAFHTRSRYVAVGKKLARIADAAHIKRSHVYGLKLLADDDFRGPTTNVDHQTPVLRRRQLIRDAGEDQTSLLLAGNDFNGKAQGSFGTRQYVCHVASDTKSVRRHSPHTVRVEARKALAKALQHRDGALDGFIAKDFVLVQPRRQPHGLLQAINRVNLCFAVKLYDAADRKSKAVGAQVARGK